MDLWCGENEKFSTLSNWMASQGSYINKFSIAYISENNRYIRASDDVEVDEILISIPTRAIVNVFNPEVSPYFKEIGEIANKESIALSLFYLAEIEKQNSQFKPYLDYLPKTMNEQPIFYSEEKKDFLKGSYMNERIKLWEEQLENEFNYLVNKDIPKNINIKNFYLPNYKFARTIVWSRNFDLTYDHKTHSSLIPFADMCNFNPNKLNTNWTYDDENAQFVLRAAKPIKKDEEIFLRYGDEDNSHFLFFYGYTIKDNPEKIQEYEFDIVNKDAKDKSNNIETIKLKSPVEILEPMINFRKSKINRIKNIKMELSALISLKKALLNKINSYKNKSNTQNELQLYDHAASINDYDTCNICGIVLEEKYFLMDYIMNIEEIEAILTEINQIKSQRFIDESQLQEMMVKLRGLNFSMNYRDMLLDYLSC